MSLWLRQGAKTGMLSGAIVGLPYVVASYGAWRPWGSRGLLALANYGLILAILLALLLSILSLPALFFSRLRPTAAVLITASGVCLLVMVLVGLATAGTEEAGVHRLIARGTPLVNAILRYEADVGHPPASLGELMPRYLREIPSTGSGAFPEWQYARRDAEHGGRWSISLSLGAMLFDFKHLAFDPTGQYLPYGARRIEGWAVITP